MASPLWRQESVSSLPLLNVVRLAMVVVMNEADECRLGALSPRDVDHRIEFLLLELELEAVLSAER